MQKSSRFTIRPYIWDIVNIFLFYILIFHKRNTVKFLHNNICNAWWKVLNLILYDDLCLCHNTHKMQLLAIIQYKNRMKLLYVSWPTLLALCNCFIDNVIFSLISTCNTISISIYSKEVLRYYNICTLSIRFYRNQFYYRYFILGWLYNIIFLFHLYFIFIKRFYYNIIEVKRFKVRSLVCKSTYI